MDRDALFLATVDDLSMRVDASDEYTLLMAAPLVRKLLADDHPLMHLVNREHRLSLRFEVTAEDDYTRLVLRDGPVFWAVMEGLSPRLGVRRRANTEELTLDQFLGHRIMRVRGEDFSVLDVVQTVAYALGAVHAGSPKKEMHQRLAYQSSAIRVGGVRAATRALRGIAAVTVDALTPLAKAVRGSAGRDDRI